MPRGMSLGTLVTNYRHEVGLSANPSLGQNTRDRIVYLLQQYQRTLFAAHDWPFKRVTEDKLVSAGQRYYDFPATIDPERIETVHYRWGTTWIPLDRGIEPEHYEIYDSDDSADRADPAQRWDIRYIDPKTQLEIWPLPAINGSASGDGRVRFTGIRQLGAFVADGDPCDVDGDLIVLGAAAEKLAEDKNPKAQAVQARFRDLWSSLTGGLAPKQAFRLGAGEPCPPEGRPQEIRVAYVRN